MDQLTTDQWWEQCHTRWAENPAFLENLESKAQRHGREWVRSNFANLEHYWKLAGELALAQSWVDEHGTLENW